jgi:hypothetical protein
MKFIDSPRVYTSTSIYDQNGVLISCLSGERCRYAVNILDLRYFVWSDTEKTPRELIEFVLKNNLISSVEFIEHVISYAQNQGEAKGRRELQSEIRKVLNT